MRRFQEVVGHRLRPPPDPGPGQERRRLLGMVLQEARRHPGQRFPVTGLVQALRHREQGAVGLVLLAGLGLGAGEQTVQSHRAPSIGELGQDVVGRGNVAGGLGRLERGQGRGFGGEILGGGGGKTQEGFVHRRSSFPGFGKSPMVAQGARATASAGTVRVDTGAGLRVLSSTLRRGPAPAHPALGL